MAKNCENCKAAKADFVPFVVYESGMTRMERSAKRLWIIIMVLIFLLVGSNVAWMVYESRFETVESTTFEVEQDADNGTNNFAGGDLNGASDG